MPLYKVTYSELHLMELDVEANSPEEAMNMVRDGNADYDGAHMKDATVMDVSSAEELA